MTSTKAIPDDARILTMCYIYLFFSNFGLKSYFSFTYATQMYVSIAFVPKNLLTHAIYLLISQAESWTMISIYDKNIGVFFSINYPCILHSSFYDTVSYDAIYLHTDSDKNNMFHCILIKMHLSSHDFFYWCCTNTKKDETTLNKFNITTQYMFLKCIFKVSSKNIFPKHWSTKTIKEFVILSSSITKHSL